MSEHKCENCFMRSYAERKPNSILARIWRWHTRWCPGWKSYQRALAEREQDARQQASEEA